MTTTTTIRAHAATVATIAAICFAGAACGAEQVASDQEIRNATQHAVTDDVAAQIENRKAALSLGTLRSDRSAADNVETLVEQRKTSHATH
jgi:hypothetical protein